ncbi:MAG: 3-hydroxyacyl-CoA dehydrogenase NAD-binding domain-containing protein [Devosia sp.]
MTKVSCVGTGLVGRAWAVVFARAGYEVALFDAKDGEVEAAALPGIRATLALFDEAGLLADPMDTIIARIRVAASLHEAVAGADYVQESIREDADAKREVFAAIAAAAPADAILASSTSAILGSRFLSDIPHPERALVAHPVNPPSLIPLVEVCGTNLTSPETVASTRRLLTGAGMLPITVNREIDGFILNRLQYTLVAEAMHLVGEGYCSPEDIDRVVTDGLALRWAFLGPFAVAHLNAKDGFQGFVDRLGPMMRRMGADARTDYPWTQAQSELIHSAMIKTMPIDTLPLHAARRDRNILALRHLRKTQR